MKEYTVKSEYYYNYEGKVVPKDKYPIRLLFDVDKTVDQLKVELKKELLRSKRLTITDEKLVVDGKEVTDGTKIVNPDSDILYSVIQLAPGYVDDPKAPK